MIVAKHKRLSIVFFIKSGLLALVFVLGVTVKSEISETWGLPTAAGIGLVILILAAVLWVTEMVPLFATSFIILFLSLVWLVPEMENEGKEVLPSQFLAPFFSDMILLFLGGFVISTALHKFFLDEQVARWIIRKAGTSLPRLTLAVMGITAVLSMFLSNTATAAMMLALVVPLAKSLPEGVGARKILVLSVPLAANVGGLGTPIGSPPNAIAIQNLAKVGIEPSFGQWMLAGVPAVLIILTIAWGILLLLFGGRGQKLEGIDCQPLKQDWTWEVKMVLLVTALTIVGWLSGRMHGFSSGTVALMPLVVLFSLKILSVKDLRELSWDVLMLMGGGLCLGVVISLSGLAAWLVSMLHLEALGFYQSVLVFAVIACVMSTLMSNTATANLILPVVLGTSLDPIAAPVIAVAFACSLAMGFPVSTPPNAMAFSSGEIKVKDLMKPGLTVSIIGLTLVLTVGYWWWRTLGLF